MSSFSIQELPKDYSELSAKLASALDTFPAFVQRLRSSARVLLKPNVMGRHAPERGRTTHPMFIEALVNALRDFADVQLAIGDGAGPGVHTEQALEITGIAGVARRLNVELLDFTRSGKTRVEVPNPYFYDTLEFATDALGFDLFINVPKLKTTYASPAAGMKNLMGTMSQASRFMFHSYGLQEGIADLVSVIRPDLTVVDGILASELRWPTTAGVFLIGEDPVATDVVACQVMSVPTSVSPCLGLAGAKGVGESDPAKIEICGSSLADAKQLFRIPPESAATLSNDRVTVIDAKPCCVGCIGTIQKGIDDIERDGLLPKMTRHVNVIVGPDWNPGEHDEDNTILVGNCTIARARTWRNVVRGSPPLIHKFGEKLIGVSASDG